MYYETISPSDQRVIIMLDGSVMTSMLENPENSEYQAYLAWVAEGNQPLPWPPEA